MKAPAKGVLRVGGGNVYVNHKNPARAVGVAMATRPWSQALKGQSIMMPAVSGEGRLETLRGLDPTDVVGEVVDIPFRIGDAVVMIVRASAHCGGSLAWAHLRDTGAWEMKGCICHNPAVGP